MGMIRANKQRFLSGAVSCAPVRKRRSTVRRSTVRRSTVRSFLSLLPKPGVAGSPGCCRCLCCGDQPRL